MPEIVQEIGAYAGLASVVGLAVLSALYFSQARDVKRLREWAGRAPERAEGQAPAVPGRVGAQPAPKPGQPRPAAPPVPGAPAVPAAASAAGARPATAAAAQERPAAPTPAPSPGQAVPVAAAAGAATATTAKPSSPEQNDVAPSENASAADSPAPEAPAREPLTPNDTAPTAPAAQPPVTKPPASTVPAGNAGNANAASKGAAPAPPAPTGARTATPRPAARSGAPTRIAAPPASVIPPPRRRSWYQGLLANPLYAVLAVAGVLILGAAAVFGVTQLTGGDDSSQVGRDSGGASNETAQGGQDADGEGNGAGKQRRGGAVKPGNVTVAVLNGTTVPGLATTLADQVTAAGFKPGTVANFLNQGLAESVVQYTPGHEREAAAVSRKVGIGQREAATAESRELAGDATVIVIAGGDKAP